MDIATFSGTPARVKFLAWFSEGAPVFAVEVRSEYDYSPAAERDMKEKRADYCAAGTLVVWDVDLQSTAVVQSYKASDSEKPVIFWRGEIAAAEAAVPRRCLEGDMIVGGGWP